MEKFNINNLALEESLRDFIKNNELSINGRYHKEFDRKLLPERVVHQMFMKLDNGRVVSSDKLSSCGMGPFPVASRWYAIGPDQPNDSSQRWFRYNVGDDGNEVVMLDGMLLKFYSPREGMIDYVPDLSNQESIKKLVSFINPHSNLYEEN